MCLHERMLGSIAGDTDRSTYKQRETWKMRIDHISHKRMHGKEIIGYNKIMRGNWKYGCSGNGTVNEDIFDWYLMPKNNYIVTIMFYKLKKKKKGTVSNSIFFLISVRYWVTQDCPAMNY